MSKKYGNLDPLALEAMQEIKEALAKKGIDPNEGNLAEIYRNRGFEYGGINNRIAPSGSAILDVPSRRMIQRERALVTYLLNH